MNCWLLNLSLASKNTEISNVLNLKKKKKKHNADLSCIFSCKSQSLRNSAEQSCVSCRRVLRLPLQS